MSRRAQAIVGVITMAALLLLYFYYAILRAVALFQTGSAITISMGVALIILPLIGFWALFREILFGMSATKLVDRLSQQDELPDEEIETLSSGKPLREEVLKLLPKYEDATQGETATWQDWLRLGIMADAAGDRTRGRFATRKAISLERSTRG